MHKKLAILNAWLADPRVHLPGGKTYLQQQPSKLLMQFQGSVLPTMFLTCTPALTLYHNSQALAVVPDAALTTAIKRAHTVACKGTEALTTLGYSEDAAKTSSPLLKTARLQMWHIFQKVVPPFGSNASVLACISSQNGTHVVLGNVSSVSAHMLLLESCLIPFIVPFVVSLILSSPLSVLASLHSCLLAFTPVHLCIHIHMCVYQHTGLSEIGPS